MKWKDNLLKKLINDLRKQSVSGNYIDKLIGNHSDAAIHLAIFSEPLLQKLLSGTKILESRFSTNRISPFGKIRSGDVVLVKKTGGPVVAIFISGVVECHSNLTPEKIESLRDKYSRNLGLSPEDNFWHEKKKARYGTLIKITELKTLPPYSIEKRDRTGWVVMRPHKQCEIFE